MADINLELNIKISDANKTLAPQAFLAKWPIPKIDDPTWVDSKDGSVAPQVDKYPSAKAWLEVWSTRLVNDRLLRAINEGIDILNRESTQKHLKSL